VTNKTSVVSGRASNETGLDLDPENRFATAIQGQLLRRSERREVAIYLRKDALWVADFIDGDGELIDAVTWFRFNCGTPFTLSAQLAARIESLHRSSTTRKRGGWARLVLTIAAYAPRTRLTGIFRKPRWRRSTRQGNPSVKARHVE
jgi:hypothetical protein